MPFTSDEEEEDAECTEDQINHTFVCKLSTQNQFISHRLNDWYEGSECNNPITGYKSQQYSEREMLYSIQTVFPTTREYIADKLNATDKSLLHKSPKNAGPP